MMFCGWYAVMSWVCLTTALHVGEGEGETEGVGGGRKGSRGTLLIYLSSDTNPVLSYSINYLCQSHAYTCRHACWGGGGCICAKISCQIELFHLKIRSL